MFFIDWLVTAVIAYFIARQAIKLELKDDDRFCRDVELTEIPTGVYALIFAIPFINVGCALVAYIYSAICYYNTEDNLFKFFKVKVPEEQDKPKKTNGYRKNY
jgi:hypothetical protein